MDDEKQKTDGKGLAQTAAENIQKIKKIKKIIAIIGPALPTIGIGLLIVLAAIVVFLPFISTFNFSGGLFNSSPYYNERAPMSMNAGGFEYEDVQIFQSFYDQTRAYNSLTLKSNPSEQLDLSILVSTIQRNNANNFNTDGDVYKLDEVLTQSEEEINNFESIEDFNEFVNKYTTVKEDPSIDQEDYHGADVIKNDQNRDYYNMLKDAGGQVFYMFPGERKLTGNLVGNRINYKAVEYKEWKCPTKDDPDKICNNESEIWSQWAVLKQINSKNATDGSCNTGSGAAADSICKISRELKYEYVHDDPTKDASWEIQNIVFDKKTVIREDFKNDEAAQGIKEESEIENMIKKLAYDYSGKDAEIPRSGIKFIVGNYYVAVSVSKSLDYDLYEKYAEDVFISYYLINCEECTYRDELPPIKAKRAAELYGYIFNAKSLFDYFNSEGTVIAVNRPSISGGSSGGNSFGGGGTASIPGISYECGTYKNGISSDYSGHRANDLYSTAPTNPNIYPLLEGEVVSVTNSCHNICPSSDANRYIAGASLSSLSSACQCGGGWGNHIQVKSTYQGKTIYAIYAHLSSVNVSVGDKINYDTVLGVMGTTGVSTGNHLHIELSYTGSSADKFPATQIFSEETVLGTLCKRKVDNGDNNE